MRDTFIQARLDGITPPDGAAMEAARRHWDAIAKPLHGLGRLEDMVVRIAGAVETPEVRLDRKGVAVFCRRPRRRSSRWTWGCWPMRRSPACGPGWSWRGAPGT